MPDLIAQGPNPNERWRRNVPPRSPLVIGREGTWAVGWDRQISRSHVEVQWKHGRLHVRKLAQATNPVFVRGKGLDPHCIENLKTGGIVQSRCNRCVLSEFIIVAAPVPGEAKNRAAGRPRPGDRNASGVFSSSAVVTCEKLILSEGGGRRN